MRTFAETFFNYFHNAELVNKDKYTVKFNYEYKLLTLTVFVGNIKCENSYYFQDNVKHEVVNIGQIKDKSNNENNYATSEQYNYIDACNLIILMLICLSVHVEETLLNVMNCHDV